MQAPLQLHNIAAHLPAVGCQYRYLGALVVAGLGELRDLRALPCQLAPHVADQLVKGLALCLFCHYAPRILLWLKEGAEAPSQTHGR